MVVRFFAALAIIAFFVGSAIAQSGEELRGQAFAMFAGTAEEKTQAIGIFEQAAAAGDAISMAFLGDLYATGNGVPADRAKAIQWYLAAAQAGHAASAAKLAEMASAPESAPPAVEPAPAAAKDPGAPLPDGVSQPLPPVLSSDGTPYPLPYLAANDEVPDAQKTPVALRREGLAFLREGNTAAALERLTRAARRDTWSALEVALLYLEGLGTPEDSAEAEGLMQAARTSNSLLPQVIGGHHFRTQFPEDAASLQRAASRQLAEMATGTGRHLFQLHYEMAYRIAEFSWTSDEHRALARQVLDHILANGYDPATGEVAAQSAIAPRAPEPSPTRAQIEYSEAEAIFLGIDALDDPRLPQLRQTIRAEAENGSISAMTTFALMLRDGAGGPVDHELAFDWYRRAADLDSRVGFLGLAGAYENGQGTRRDLDQALLWYERALEAGVDTAERGIDRVRAAQAAVADIVPGVNWPFEDRWGSFKQGSVEAVGIASGEAMFAFACVERRLRMFYVPAGTPVFDERPGEELWLLIASDNRGTSAYLTRTTNAYMETDPEVVETWLGMASSANTITIGLTEEPNFASFMLGDAASFTGRGSSAAISQLRDTCR